MKALNKEGKKVNLLEVIADYAAELDAFAKSGVGYTEKANITTWTNVVKGIEDYAGKGAIKAKDVQVGSDLATVMENTNAEKDADADWSTIKEGTYKEAKAALKELKDFKADYGKWVGIDSDGEYSNDLAGAGSTRYL